MGVNFFDKEMYYSDLLMMKLSECELNLFDDWFTSKENGKTIYHILDDNIKILEKAINFVFIRDFSDVKVYTNNRALINSINNHLENSKYEDLFII